MVDRDVLRQVTVAAAVGGGFIIGVSGDYGDAAAGPSLVVPANYAFSIWAPIYAGLFSHAVYQALPAQRRDPVLAGAAVAVAGVAGVRRRRAARARGEHASGTGTAAAPTR